MTAQHLRNIKARTSFRLVLDRHLGLEDLAGLEHNVEFIGDTQVAVVALHEKGIGVALFAGTKLMSIQWCANARRD